MRKLGIWLWIGLALVPAVGGTKQSSTNLIRNGDFEQWEWREFSDSQRKAVKSMLAEGRKLSDLNCEIRGPLARGLVGYGELSGVMVEGKDAWQGRSLLLTAGDTELEWGYHWMLLKKLKADATYRYDVMLRGTGTFMLRISIGARNAAGEFKWLGFPDLAVLKPTETWQRCQGTITVPRLATGDLMQDDSNIALHLASGSRVMIDNLQLWEGSTP